MDQVQRIASLAQKWEEETNKVIEKAGGYGRVNWSDSNVIKDVVDAGNKLHDLLNSLAHPPEPAPVVLMMSPYEFQEVEDVLKHFIDLSHPENKRYATKILTDFQKSKMKR